MLMRQRRLLVYELSAQASDEVVLPTGMEWTRATRDSVVRFFRDDPRRKKTFSRFIDKGYYGVIIYHGAEWVNYGWMSTPNTFGPPHLPPGLRQRPVYWLFYAHTAPTYRGRGLHRYGMKLRIAHAFNITENAKIYTDTTADNVASRKGIRSVGFEPKGIIDTHELRISRVKPWVWGSWDVDANHPRLDGGTSS